MHKMKVQTKYYNLLKSGKKVVELRLFDEKRQQIKIGDEILFSNLSDGILYLYHKIILLIAYANYVSYVKLFAGQAYNFNLY